MGVRTLRSSVGISVVLHALLALACLTLIPRRATESPDKYAWIEIQAVPPVATPKKTEEQKLRRQIVQTTPGEKVEQARPDSFLGERTQVVRDQTVGKQQVASAPEQNHVGKKPIDDFKSLTEERVQPDLGPLSKFGMPVLPKPRKPGETMEDPGPEWAQLPTLPQDYVKGFRQSERTALNTKEYVFYGYFQRIRERLDRAWVPILRHKLMAYYHGGRRLASDMDHTTRIMVTLNPGGEIVRVQVMDESGTKDLDEAAISAFNKAGPFPNPPRGIVDRNGEIKIPWEFILKT